VNTVAEKSSAIALPDKKCYDVSHLGAPNIDILAWVVVLLLRIHTITCEAPAPLMLALWSRSSFVASRDEPRLAPTCRRLSRPRLARPELRRFDLAAVVRTKRKSRFRRAVESPSFRLTDNDLESAFRCAASADAVDAFCRACQTLARSHGTIGVASRACGYAARVNSFQGAPPSRLASIG